nr:DNA cytosine methyltransferase [Desulfobacula sp.]
MVMTGSPKFCSLFSGCGGFDLGFVNAGYECIGAYDIDLKALNVHEHNLGGSVFNCDLTTSDFPISNLCTADIILSGSPCQGFSTIGKRKINDPRNNLLLTGGELAIKSKTKVFISENVLGVIAGRHRKYWDELHQMFRTAGYKTTDIKCNGTEVGIAQRRRRLFLLAWSFPKEINVSIKSTPGGTLKDALEGVESTKNHTVIPLKKDSIDYLISKRIKAGQKLSNVRGGYRSVHTWDIPEVYGQTTNKERMALETILRVRRQMRVRNFGDADPVPKTFLYKNFGEKIINSLVKKGYLRCSSNAFDLTKTFNGKYRRLPWDKPSYTIDTRFGNPKYFLHPEEHRGFTVREAARIQGFPDSFIFSGTQIEQYRMIGNAVPPPMAEHLASFVREAFFK